MPFVCEKGCARIKKVIIISAGFTGCTYALLLKEKGWDVTLIEKDNVLGGGVRTTFTGADPFTYGPRHFLSPYREAYEFMMKYVPLRDIKKINYTFVEGDGSFYTYPPHADDIVKMPEKEEIRKELEGLPEEGGTGQEFRRILSTPVG